MSINRSNENIVVYTFISTAQSNPMTIPFFSCLNFSRLIPKSKQLYLLFTFLIQISYFSCVSGQCLNDQRALLLQLKNTLTYNTSLSTKLVYWNKNTDCCNWNGVECDSFGHVIGLKLDEETISGGIENSSALYSFRHLKNLNLAYNYFDNARIPRELGNLTNLARLNLSTAEFGGQIPVELSKMPNLVMLALSGYRLEYPNLKNFVQNLTRLEELYLDGVDFMQKEGWWEALSLALPNLRSLSLSDCGLSGHLNSSFLQLRTLSVLRLDGNNLSSTSLDFFAKFRNLTVLSLGNCNLQGTFPAGIFQVSTLQYLDLLDNVKLSGTIPEFSPHGSLTNSIMNLSNLSLIDISGCNFSGPIPFSIRNLSNLVFLDFSQNSFTGSVPIFSMSKKLKYMDLSNNSLSGSLSSTHFEGLSNLQKLDLSYNSLTGNIPTSLFSLPSLRKLYLHDNKFSGQVPKSFFRLQNLTRLDLSLNLFTIQLEDFQTLQNLYFLSLSYNLISSVNISSSGKSFPQLHYLNLVSCNLSRFPNLRNQKYLVSLDLSSNKISGDIPNWIWEIGIGSLERLNLSNNLLTSLQTPYLIPNSLLYLDLQSNMLHGDLPPVLEKSLRYVDYSNNHFQGHISMNVGLYITFFISVANNSLTGDIPVSICSASGLRHIDMSDNLLSGELPPCLLQNLTGLGVLNIARNNISGYIPDTFPIYCSLSTLDLSRNNFRGNIPPSLRNCEYLQVLNVASNSLDGTFPCNLMNLSDLHVLVLRSNKLFGDIRCHGFVPSWSNLQIIDIAFNSFAGFVDPRFISSLTGMKLKNSSQSAGDPLGFQDSDGFFYYQDTVTVTSKGQEWEIVKILITLTSIDFSSNKFRGVIPETFGELKSLHALNLSHNSFIGTIPKSLGKLTNLESLGLSENELTGNIPTELVSLTFLSFFDVSYNELVGRIPSGRQFDTFSAASYEGNFRLCGSAINKSCDSSVPTKASTTRTGEKDVDWLFMLAGLGYAVGIALVVVPPLFSRRWGDRWEELQVKLIQSIFPAYTA